MGNQEINRLNCVFDYLVVHVFMAFLVLFTGVTVKLIPPVIESVNTSIPGTAKFTEKVYPEDSLSQEDPTSVGFTFTKSDDPSVDRYGISFKLTSSITNKSPVNQELSSLWILHV